MKHDVRSLRAAGKSKEDIYLTLLKEGWKVSAIEAQWDTAHTSTESGADLSRHTIQVIVTTGAVLIGAGVFSFVAANWQDMTDLLRMLVILASMLLSYLAGWVFLEQYKLPRASEALILLGNLIFGAGIFLIAQMFHIRADWPDGFLLWMLGSVAVAWALRLPSIFVLACVVGMIGVIGHPFLIFGMNGSSGFLLSSPLLLILATIVTFLTGFLLRRALPPRTTY